MPGIAGICRHDTGPGIKSGGHEDRAVPEEVTVAEWGGVQYVHFCEVDMLQRFLLTELFEAKAAERTYPDLRWDLGATSALPFTIREVNCHPWPVFCGADFFRGKSRVGYAI